MNIYRIRGGEALKGEVDISGAKNAALPILAATILTDETITLENVPKVNDTVIMVETLEKLGSSVEYLDDNTLRINTSAIDKYEVKNPNIKKIRASYYFAGALLGRYRQAVVPLPGGCNIGGRGLDMHEKGFEALGASVKITASDIVVDGTEAELSGTRIYMDKVSVGATINIMLAAVLTPGKTIIEGAAKEPHVVDVANFINGIGGHISGAGTDRIRITGVQSLRGGTYAVIPDQIEAGTFMMAAAITHGDITVKNVIPTHLESISSKLKEIGCKIQESDDWVRVIGPAGRLKRTQVKTLPYPGFPTDMQPQISVALGLADGISTVVESIFDNRFMYVNELKKMGCNITVDESTTAYIDGVEYYQGANMTSPDLRAGAALVLAALAAKGGSDIDGIEYIERGYENFDKKLRQLGADIQKMEV
ncbi:MAG: UDP-N-acetylglucosamine 1-carboxyvinyltransferase [Lachnospiraceae bacterium]|nr:UDP-N-acetylglucosamine 1-carboxyvinyltransferase [Lachnospiraceae bacterium]